MCCTQGARLNLSQSHEWFLPISKLTFPSVAGLHQWMQADGRSGQAEALVAMRSRRASLTKKLNPSRADITFPPT